MAAVTLTEVGPISGARTSRAPLLIVGLSSLLVGGVGISNAVSAYIQERQRAIATLRSLGATGPRILVHFFTQVGIMSLVAGIAIPPIVMGILALAAGILILIGR